MSSVTAPQYNQRGSPDSLYRKRCRSATRTACVPRVSPGAPNVEPQSTGLPQKEGSNGRLSRSRDTRYGTEVREVGPFETPRHQDTVNLPATTVPPTVVALRPKRAEAVARAQFPQMGIDPGRHQLMQIIPSMHVVSRDAIITNEGEKPSRAQRAAPAAWCPVGRRLPRPLGHASALSGAPIRPPVGPACRARRVGYAPRVARAGQRGRPLAPAPASPRRRPPPPLASPPHVEDRVPRRRQRPRGGPMAHRGPRSTTQTMPARTRTH